MGNSVYNINKGINKSIEFKGLKAQYIWYLGGCLIVLLIIFASLYIIGINPFICVGLIFGSGTFLVMKIYQLSNKYGEHGMMKSLARRSIPRTIKSYSRNIFKPKTILNNGKAS